MPGLFKIEKSITAGCLDNPNKSSSVGLEHKWSWKNVFYDG